MDPSSKNKLRWLAPPVAFGTIVAGVVIGQAADASPTLPDRTAEQLLVDLQKAEPVALSGTVTDSINLGLPALPESMAGGDASLASLAGGTHTWRVWTDGADRSRVSLVAGSQETNIVRNGSDVWQWSSAEQTATHHVLSKPTGSDHAHASQPPATALPTTPEAAAQQVLAKLDPTTQVTTAGTGSVAGRAAYELVLTPRDADTRVADVTISVDAEHHIPLRVQVSSTKTGANAIDIGFSSLTFGTPAASVFAFTPPPGATVVEATPGTVKQPDTGQTADHPADAQAKPQVVGAGWTAVTVGYLPAKPADPHADARTAARAGDSDAASAQASGEQLLQAFPTVTGSWGTGRVLDGTLVSAVVTEDGRYAVGAVAPDALFQALPPAR